MCTHCAVECLSLEVLHSLIANHFGMSRWRFGGGGMSMSTENGCFGRKRAGSDRFLHSWKGLLRFVLFFQASCFLLRIELFESASFLVIFLFLQARKCSMIIVGRCMGDLQRAAATVAARTVSVVG